MSKQENVNERVKSELTSEALTLADVALILTLLDEKVHQHSFYERFGDKGSEDQYKQAIEKIQRIISNQIEPDRIVTFLEKNNHLAKHFVNRKHEFDYKEVAHLFQYKLFEGTDNVVKFSKEDVNNMDDDDVENFLRDIKTFVYENQI